MSKKIKKIFAKMCCLPKINGISQHVKILPLMDFY